MRRFSGFALLGALLIAGLSCGHDSAGPSGPGQLRVRLTSPASNVGVDTAIVFTITGPAALTSATVPAGIRLFQQPLGGTSTRFALIGRLTNGATILTVGIPDMKVLAQYSGSIQGVATPSFQLRALPGGYALALIR